MVEILTKNRFKCSICEKIYDEMEYAKECEEEHDIVYVPFQRSDLKRLVAYINTGNISFLTESLIRTMDKYSRIKSE